MSNPDYINRIKRVVEYIEANSAQKIDLEALAAISYFSKYHFSRIFTSVVGITPIAFVNRERLKKSLSYLLETKLPILELSQLAGFESLSTFNAVFKKQFNMTPSKARNSPNSNFSLLLSNKLAEVTPPVDYNKRSSNPLLRRAWDSIITITEFPEYEAAYMRHVGSYLDTPSVWKRLAHWAAENDLSPRDQFFVGISLDDLNDVAEEACRYDACITLPHGFEKAQQTLVEFRSLAGGMYALYPYYDTIAKFVLAYQHMFGLWLPNSEYEVDDRPCLEFSRNNPAEDPHGKCKIDLYIPIKLRI